jgi:holo-[acyl-carrier protein] synthase
MIVGIGTDLCDVRRIDAALKRHGDRFAAKLLGEAELTEFHARQAASDTRATCYLATRFAAKEAFAKAIGLGVRDPMRWRDCQILLDDLGKPSVHLSGPLAQWFAQRPWQAHVSLSDEGDHALAFVVIDHTAPTP